MDEPLLGAPRREVDALARLEERERGLEHGGQRRAIVAVDEESAASLRAVRGEHGEDEVPAWPDRRRGTARVGQLVVVIGQEVQGGAVVPHVDGPVEAQRAHVGVDVVDGVGCVSERVTEPGERHRRDVDGVQVTVPGLDEVDDERGGAGTDDRDPAGGADTRRTRLLQGSDVDWNQLTASGAVVDQTSPRRQRSSASPASA